jgi:hypothetical protein
MSPDGTKLPESGGNASSGDVAKPGLIGQVPGIGVISASGTMNAA